MQGVGVCMYLDNIVNTNHMPGGIKLFTNYQSSFYLRTLWTSLLGDLNCTKLVVYISNSCMDKLSIFQYNKQLH